MSEILKCCSLQSMNEAYIGVQQKCLSPAIFCIQHSAHKNTQGLLHQMLPLKTFKRVLHQKKLKMNQKIAVLIDQYNNLMDALIQQIQELKLSKNIQFSLLWLRQLAKDQQEYQLMRQLYRMDFNNLTCSMMHSVYYKIVHNQILQKKSIQQIDCYKGICQILDHLSQEKQTRTFLSKKISQIQGILQNGEILKRSLPDKMVFKQNIKQVLVQTEHIELCDIKYNKCKLKKASRQYISIFSKYPLSWHINYHIRINSKYLNLMLGICKNSLITGESQGEDSSFNQSINNQRGQFNKHYSKQSLVFNCSNGCIFRDGMFKAGSNAVIKDKKEIDFKLRLTNNELIIMYGKHVLCRQDITHLLTNNQDRQFYLHLLMRTQADQFQVDRDKDITSVNTYNFNPEHAINKQAIKQTVDQISHKQFDYQQLKMRNQKQALTTNYLKKQIQSKKYQSDVQLHFPLNLLYQSNQRINTNQNKVTQQVDIFQLKQRQKIIKNKQQRQDRLNQLIKRQRIDKILNDIKSKPFVNSSSQNKQQISTKIKRIQAKKISDSIIKLNTQQSKSNSMRSSLSAVTVELNPIVNGYSKQEFLIPSKQIANPSKLDASKQLISSKKLNRIEQLNNSSNKTLINQMSDKSKAKLKQSDVQFQMCQDQSFNFDLMASYKSKNKFNLQSNKTLQYLASSVRSKQKSDKSLLDKPNSDQLSSPINNQLNKPSKNELNKPIINELNKPTNNELSKVSIYQLNQKSKQVCSQSSNFEQLKNYESQKQSQILEVIKIDDFDIYYDKSKQRAKFNQQHNYIKSPNQQNYQNLKKLKHSQKNNSFKNSQLMQSEILEEFQHFKNSFIQDKQSFSSQSHSKNVTSQSNSKNVMSKYNSKGIGSQSRNKHISSQSNNKLINWQSNNKYIDSQFNSKNNLQANIGFISSQVKFKQRDQIPPINLIEGLSNRKTILDIENQGDDHQIYNLRVRKAETNNNNYFDQSIHSNYTP